MRPTPEELEAFGPEFAPRWKEYFLPRPDKPVLWMGQLAVYVAHMSGSLLRCS